MKKVEFAFQNGGVELEYYTLKDGKWNFNESSFIGGQYDLDNRGGTFVLCEESGEHMLPKLKGGAEFILPLWVQGQSVVFNQANKPLAWTSEIQILVGKKFRPLKSLKEAEGYYVALERIKNEKK